MLSNIYIYIYAYNESFHVISRILLEILYKLLRWNVENNEVIYLLLFYLQKYLLGIFFPGIIAKYMLFRCTFRLLDIALNNFIHGGIA